MIVPGSVLGGKYVVERVLGEGGMGMVIAATHVELGHRVAIKTMNDEARANPEVVSRFEREARAAAKLQSEHTVRVTDVGRFEDGAPYMVMEFLEGEDLAQRLARERALGLVDALSLFMQCCVGLHDAHAMGLVHRDVKPSNIFLVSRRSGRVVAKVIDFGIAKATDTGSDHTLTQTSSVMGSPQYMSPEQLNHAKDVDARTDVWSLGASFYEAITGSVAFPAKTLAQLHVQILTAAPRSLQELRPEVPPELEAIVLRCLARDVADRYASMLELHRELESMIGRLADVPRPMFDSGPDLRLPLGAVTGSEAFATTEYGQGGAPVAGFEATEMSAAHTSPGTRPTTVSPARKRLGVAGALAALGLAAVFGMRPRHTGTEAHDRAASAPPAQDEPPAPSDATRARSDVALEGGAPPAPGAAPATKAAAEAPPAAPPSTRSAEVLLPRPAPRQAVRPSGAVTPRPSSTAVAEPKAEAPKPRPRGSVLNPEFDE